MESLEDIVIKPALEDDGKNPQLTNEEFQMKLYSCFNQNGLLSSMRSYLRSELIASFRKTSLRNALPDKDERVSLEHQAFNVLIADHLFQYKYDFSLSVFSTEVPIKNLVTELCFLTFDMEKKKVRQKLDDANVLCILDGLGISGSSEVASEIMANYKKMRNISLVFCIVKVLMNFHKSDTPELTESSSNEIAKIIRKMMMQFNVPPYVINQMIEKVNYMIRTRFEKANNELEKKYAAERAELEKEYKKKEEIIVKKMAELKNVLSEEFKKTKEERRQLNILTEKLKSKEKKLTEDSRLLNDKLERANMLEVRIAKELEDCVSDNVRKSSTRNDCKLKHCDEACNETQNRIEQLAKQKNQLQEMVESQKSLISNLTIKYTIIHKQCEQKNETIEDLKKQLDDQKRLILKFEKIIQGPGSEKTTSGSEGTGMGIEGDGDYKDVIQLTQQKLLRLEKETSDVEKDFEQLLCHSKRVHYF